MYPSQVARSFSRHQLHKDHNVLSLRISTPSPATRTPKLPYSFPVSVPQVPLRAALVATVNRFKTEKLQQYTGRARFCALCSTRKVVPASKHSSVVREKLTSEVHMPLGSSDPSKNPIHSSHSLTKSAATNEPPQIQHRHH
jgi:hypothetical protein